LVGEVSEEFIVIIDNEPPLRAEFDLDPTFDTGEVGDTYTTLGLVTLVGTAIPNAAVTLLNSGQTTTSDADGNFTFTDVQLELGRQIYEVEVVSLAGNRNVSRKSIAFDQPISLTESGFVTESTQLVNLSEVFEGTRTVTFSIDSNLESTASGLEDSFHVYLVDPADPSTTLLDRGDNGTSLFSLIDGEADFLPGLVRFDGSVVEVDVTGIEGFDEGMLLFQLINNDGDTSAQVDISQIGSVVNPLPSFLATAGDALDTSVLNSSTDLSVEYENIRYDSSTGTYTADIRVRNDGPDIGRTIVATFDSLANDITLLNASGVDGSGSPYVSFRSAIPTYGLLAGQVSDRVQVQFTAPTTSPFAVAPSISDGGANSAPVLDPIDTIDVMPGDVVRVDLSATDADGEGFYYSLRSTTDLPNITLDTDTSTRISGHVLDVDSTPLEGIPVELGGTSVLTDASGFFELSFADGLPDDTLFIRGEAFTGPEVYPFVAESLPLLLGHGGFEGFNNFVERPIYLPALDTANAVTIDPLVDVTVTTSAIPNASVFVEADTLEIQGGGDFTGELSITEVPVEFTPAALPANLFPDLVVTIQPADLVFTTPAPLNLPNLAGYFPGTELTLWSINPNSGLFDDVGVGVVSADGTTVETVSGGINNRLRL